MENSTNTMNSHGLLKCWADTTVQSCDHANLEYRGHSIGQPVTGLYQVQHTPPELAHLKRTWTEIFIANGFLEIHESLAINKEV